MKKILFLAIIFAGIVCRLSAQNTNLTGIYDARNAFVQLSWNMVNAQYRTAYVLLRSDDGITWTEAAKDRMLRNYTDEDMYILNDKNFYPGKTFYRLRIFDGSNNTVTLSPVVTVYTSRVNNQPVPQPKISAAPTNNYPSNSNNSNNWVLYPNPATDFIIVEYKGRDNLKGVVNIQVQDGSGKVVLKFRSGSMYKSIQVPMPYLQRGVYFIQVSVLNEVVMNQRFIKQ